MPTTEPLPPIPAKLSPDRSSTIPIQDFPGLVGGLLPNTATDLESARHSSDNTRLSKFSRLRRSQWYLLFSPYHKIFVLVFILNLAWFLYLIIQFDQGHGLDSSKLATAVAANFSTLVLIRIPEVVNFLFLALHGLARYSPSWLRHMVLAQVHHYGGLHSGCATSATVWYLFFMAVRALDCRWEHNIDRINFSVVVVVAALLLVVLGSSLPKVRSRWHDQFEVVHRFAGWFIIGMFWIQTVLIAKITAYESGDKTINIFCRQPSTWFLVTTTLLVIYSWTRIRKVTVRYTQHLSNHALRLYFDELPGAQSCRAIKLSDAPLREWHPFACIPEMKSQPGFSVIISKAGDWTNSVIQNPPKQIWIKEVPQYGVLWNATMFARPLIVATGSGIGPCLGLFHGYPDIKCRILWSARHVEEVYGQEISESVRSMDPEALIIDTHRDGKPVLEDVACRLYKEASADAVFVISNPKSTDTVVAALRRRGINAYGPIWDS